MMQISNSNNTKAANQSNSLEALDDKIRKVAEFYEASFVKMLTDEMRKHQENSLLDGGQTEKVFQDMLDNEYAQQVPKNSQSSLGIADLVENDLRQKIGLPQKVKKYFSQSSPSGVVE